jgi:hypothetical protein
LGIQERVQGAAGAKIVVEREIEIGGAFSFFDRLMVFYYLTLSAQCFAVGL